MRRPVAHDLARLTDRATQYVLGGCSAGRYLPDSWHVVSRFVALRAAKRRSREWGATDRHEGRTLGGVGSQWVEEGGVRSSGWIGRQHQVGGWMGGVSGKLVTKVESTDERR